MHFSANQIMPFLVDKLFVLLFAVYAQLCTHDSQRDLLLCPTLSSPSALRVCAMHVWRRVSTLSCFSETIFQPEIFACKCFPVIVFSRETFGDALFISVLVLFRFLGLQVCTSDNLFLKPQPETVVVNTSLLDTSIMCFPAVALSGGWAGFAPTRCVVFVSWPVLLLVDEPYLELQCPFNLRHVIFHFACASCQ